MNQTIRQHRRLVKGNAHIGVKYPMAIDKEKAQLIESRKIARWFWPLCVAGYAAIWYLFYLMLSSST